MAWSFVGVSSPVISQAGSITLTEPAGCAAGDLLVAIISYRIASATPLTAPDQWQLVNQRNANSILTTTSAVASGYMGFAIRGDAQPYSVFTFPTTVNQAIGRIVAYRDVNMVDPLDTSSAFTTAINTLSVSGAGLTTAAANDLLVFAACGGQEATWTNFDAVTNPTTTSGSGSGSTAAPTVGTWLERADSSSVVGADGSLGIADAIRGTAGATGNFTATASLGASHAVIVGAFKMGPTSGIATPGSSTITQTGSTQQFSAVAGNTGTQSITVPADAEIAVVGVLGRSDDTGFFDTDLTLTKGGTDVAMTRVGPTGQTSSQTPVMYYLALPDTGAGKSLKWNWTGTNPPPAGAEPTISVTFWKGVDTASPVRSSGSQGEVAQRFFATTGTLTAQNGDLVVGFVGGYNIAGAEGSVDVWLNLNSVSQWTFSGPHDGAWGTFAPSGDLSVGGLAATNLAYGVCAAIVLKPTPSKLVSYARNGTNSVNSPLTVTFPATLAGDCIIYAGGCNASAAVTVQANTGAAGVHGTLGGVQTPRASSGANFSYVVGLIAAPAAGTTSVTLSCSNATLEKELAVWVVRGLTNPTQDKGVYSINQGPGTLLVSGLTGTLAAAEEFAVAYGVAMAESTTGINTAQTGSSGFIADQVTTPIFGSTYSHQETTVTTQIQSAFNQTGGTGDALCATYYSGAAGVTGTLATTEGADVAAMTGNVTRIANLATTEAIDVTLINATVRWAATLATTEAPDVAAINATVRWAATLAETEDPDVAALVGTVRWSGSLAVTEAPDVALINGTVVAPLVGDLATTEAPDVAALLGTISWQATLATTEAPDIAAFLGVTRWAVTLATTEAPDVAAFTGTTKDPASGPLATTEAPDVGAFVGTIRWQATLATTEAPDVGAFTGTTRWVATLTATEAPDVALFNGVVRDPIAATLATIEPPDVGAFTGNVYVPAAGTLGAIEPADGAAFTGGVLVAGTLGAVEAPDVAALIGTTRWTATLTTTEAPDLGAFLGAARWIATLATTELPDVAALTGATRWAAVLATTEAPDTAALTGTVRWPATLATVEAPDAAAFSGGIYASGPLAVTELSDTVQFAGGIYATGTLITTEAPDVYAGLGTVFGAGVNANLAAIEPADGAAFLGQVSGVAGLLAAVEPSDPAAFLGTTRWVATLSTREAADAAAFLVTSSWLATLATTEAKDTAAMLGNVQWVTALATREAADSAAFTGIAGALPAGVVLDTTEAPDLAAFTGTTVSVGTLATREAPDLSAFVGGIYADGVLNTTERPDGALFTAEPPDIAETPGRILWSDPLRVRELASGESRLRVLAATNPPTRELGRASMRVRSLKYPIPRTHVLIKNLNIHTLTGA